MLTQLAWTFDSEQLAHMLKCFKCSWGGTTKNMINLIDFIRNLARDDKDGIMAKEASVVTLVMTNLHSTFERF